MIFLTALYALRMPFREYPGVEYNNFKAAIAERQGADRAHVYGAVWAAMFAFQQRRALDRS